MTPTPWTRSMSVERAAYELHVGMADVARWVVAGRLRARVEAGARRPTAETVLVCAVDVTRWRRDGTVTACPVEDPRFDHFTATSILSRRRTQTGWPPKWEGMPGASSSPRSHPNPRRMGVTEKDQIREVNSMVWKLGDTGSGWVAVALLCRKLAKRDWGIPPRVREIVDSLIESGDFEERMFRPRVGRPSRQIRPVAFGEMQ